MVQKIVGSIILKQNSVGFFSTLYQIGDSDGPSGLLAGLIPIFLADVLSMISIQVFRYSIELALNYYLEVKLGFKFCSKKFVS